MSEIERHHHQQIEDWLGRPLTDDELCMVDSLDALTDAQLAVVAAIRPRNLIAPMLFLRAVVPDARFSDVSRVIEDIEDLVATRKQSEWQNLALFERYLGRTLLQEEKVGAAGLHALSPAQLSVAALIARQEVPVATLYLHRIAPTATVDACQELAKQLATSSSSAGAPS